MMVDSSDSEVDKHEEKNQNDSQMTFVSILSNYKVLFDKRQTTGIKREKEIAANELALVYSRNCNKKFTTKQIMKKFNNMKTKIKSVSDRSRIGNKKMKLSDWQKKFLSLWEDENEKKPVLRTIPGAIDKIVIGATSTGGITPCSIRQISQDFHALSYTSVSNPNKIKHLITPNNSEEPEEFRYKTLQQLQRECLIQKIMARRAQESAAKEMTEYYKRQNSNVFDCSKMRPKSK